MTSLNTRLQLELLNRKKGRNLLEKGFTLVELMIVIIIVGVLSSVALPNLLGNRDRAAAQAAIGAMDAFAKQCNGNILSENPTALAGIPDTIDHNLTADAGGLVSCGTVDTTTGVFTAVDPVTFAVTVANPTRLQGIRCGVNGTGAPQLANGTTDATCTLRVENGAVTGEWSAAVG